MSWIYIIPFEKATGKLKSIYNKIKGPNNQIDNVLGIHSLRPHTLTGHMPTGMRNNCDNTFFYFRRKRTFDFPTHQFEVNKFIYRSYHWV